MKRFHDETNDRLRSHLADIVDAHDDARRLKTPKGLTPIEAIREAWIKEPEAPASTHATKDRD